MGGGVDALEQPEENVPVELDRLHAGRVVAGYVLVAYGHQAPVSDTNLRLDRYVKVSTNV